MHVKWIVCRCLYPLIFPISNNQHSQTKYKTELSTHTHMDIMVLSWNNLKKNLNLKSNFYKQVRGVGSLDIIFFFLNFQNYFWDKFFSFIEKNKNNDTEQGRFLNKNMDFGCCWNKNKNLVHKNKNLIWHWITGPLSG